MDKTQKFENILKYLKGEIDFDQLGDKLLGGENLDFLKEENYDAYKQEELKCITDPEFYQFLIDNKSLVEAMKEYGDILKKYLNIKYIENTPEAIENREKIINIITRITR